MLFLWSPVVDRNEPLGVQRQIVGSSATTPLSWGEWSAVGLVRSTIACELDMIKWSRKARGVSVQSVQSMTL